MKAMYRVLNEYEEGQETSNLTWVVCVSLPVKQHEDGAREFV